MNPIITDLFRLIGKHWHKLALVAALGIWGAVLAFPRQTWLSPRSGGKIEIIFCNSGQGDETLIQQGFRQILIDGSRPGRALECLSRHLPFFDRTIDVVAVTHPELDHFGGINDVVDRYQVMSFVYNGVAGKSDSWAQLSKLIADKKIPISVLSAGDEIRAGEMRLKVLWPEKTMDDRTWKVGLEDGKSKIERSGLSPSNVLGVASSRPPNQDGLVMVMTYGNFKALFTADIGEEEEKEIIRLTGQQVNILKVPHHGSKFSSSSEFLEAVRPALAVIEVGKNSYGHPAAEVIKRLEAVGAKVMRTDQGEDVVVETDGKRWEIVK